jgi:hypothetical protein
MECEGLTLQIDDAGVGDLLSGVVIGIYRPETERFDFEVIGVKYFQKPKFSQKAYLHEAASTALRLVRCSALGEAEMIEVCSSFILAEAVKQLRKAYGESRVKTVKITGKAQDKTEQAYLDEIRKLGYYPLSDRDVRRARSFFHMLRWVRKDRSRLRHAKTGWPRLRRYIRL